MTALPLDALQQFIVRAKAATYVGSGSHTRSCRPASHDLEFRETPFAYLDSYFRGPDFIGEEVAYYQEQPVGLVWRTVEARPTPARLETRLRHSQRS